MQSNSVSKVKFAEFMATLQVIPETSRRSDRSNRSVIGPDSDIPEGNRNATLTSLAGSMRYRGMSQVAIVAALHAENQARCDPPLDGEEVEGIAASICRYDPDVTASRPKHTRATLTAMIEATADFDDLTGTIAEQVTLSSLRDPEKEILRKAIARKAKVSVASLKQDAKHHAQSGTFDHLQTAVEVKHQFGDGNLFHAQGFPWCWDGTGVWSRLDDREIKHKIHQIAADQGLTANVINSILDMVKTETHISNFVFNADTSTINCLNGELKLVDSKWQLLPHNRDHYHTAMLPVAYDRAATAPRFLQFLDEVFNGDADADDKAAVVLEALGYTLTTGCQLERFFMLIGSGANGKSVLLAIVAELIGRKYVSAVQPSQFENRFQRGHLQGKLANIITEIAEGAEIADAQLKSLVSGEMTTAEHKHKDPFDFIPYAKHWFGTNHLPHTRDFSDALFRRAKILTFNNKFEGSSCDVHLADKLKAELPGILNLALVGLQRLLERNAFTECSSSTEIAQLWRMEADQAAQFVDDACETDPGFTSPSRDLYQHYQMWAEEAGIKRTLNRVNFTKRLLRLGYKPGRTNKVRMIEGLRERTRSNAQDQ
jgi:putative DNA primase/helicase